MGKKWTRKASDNFCPHKTRFTLRLQASLQPIPLCTPIPQLLKPDIPSFTSLTDCHSKYHTHPNPHIRVAVIITHRTSNQKVWPVRSKATKVSMSKAGHGGFGTSLLAWSKLGFYPNPAGHESHQEELSSWGWVTAQASRVKSRV